MPHKAGRISGIYGIYGLIGATFSYVAAGLLFPVTKTNHSFYYFTVVVTAVSNVALLAAVQPSPPRAAIAGMDKSPWYVRGAEVAREWCGSEAYLPWRRVVLSRTLYYFGGGVFGGSVLFFLIDCTDSKDPLSDMALIAVLSLSGSFLAAWPAGKLSDTAGSVACVLVAGLIMGTAFGAIPLLHSVVVVYTAMPFYGAAQQIYNVADLAMITAALPNPDKRARDMGGWAAIQNIGGALGGLFGGVVITWVGGSDQTVSDIRDDDGDDGGGDRTVYTRTGYAAIFWPAALATLVSGLILWPLRKRLRAPDEATPREKYNFVSSSVASDNPIQNIKENEV
jgi:MFS family permease